MAMETVRGPDGERYVLVDRAAESSRVRDPRTGEERSVATDALDPADEESTLATAASGVPAAVRRAVTAAHDERSLGLLIEVADRGPVAVERLLDAYDLCESDLHGLLAEFRAAGLLEETRVHGRRGYDATETAREAVAALRVDADDAE